MSVNWLNSRIIYQLPLEKTSESIGNFSYSDNILVVCGRTALISVRFSLTNDITSPTTVFKYKSEYEKYLPLNYYAANGVVFSVVNTWTGNAPGVMFINSGWNVGVGGGLKKNIDYIGQTSYVIR